MKLKKSERLRREFYCSLLNLFNLKEDFNSLPFKVKESFFKFTWPKIQIEKESDDPLVNEVFVHIEDVISKNFVEIKGSKIFLNQFHGVFAVYSYFNMLNLTSIDFLKSKQDKKIQKLFELTTSILRKMDEHLKDFQVKDYLEAISFLVTKEVFKYFSIDEKGLYAKFILKSTVGKKPYPVVLICISEPKQKTLYLDNQIRIGYECSYFHNGEIIPTIWKENVIDNDQPFPVYIQDHAIKRVFERGIIGNAEKGYVHDSILRSLENPIFNGMDGPSYLVEYKYYSARMGYFLVSKEKDCAIVRTFKFITMVGTPEFYMLKRALRGTKEDFEYLGIDSLEILLNSDIYKDEKLMGIFQRCGMSDLLNIGKNIKFESPKNMIAEEIKKYFKI